MNVFDLFAKISLDSSGYETGLRAAKDLGGKVADGISAVFKASTVAVTAAGTAVAGLAKKSLDASADFEQLVGGVDKIFGESSKKVQEYANQAYKTAGLSANEYMQTVTGFSASLLQSLGGDTEKAAETANRAIIDMADNMNTYGSDMSSIQNAYQGFAKQNYTMLDNLKLGYGGTKEEMARLIEDASGMNEEMKELGVTVDKDSMEFGNIINAISVMQQHMKIAGTTSKEAAGTISGSIGSMKAAWQNFLTGTGSAKQFSDVLSISIENISEKLDVIIPRLSEGLTELVTQISPEIPKIMEKTLPTVIQGASTLITGLANGLPQLLPAVLPSLSRGVVDVFTALVGVMPQLVKPLGDSVKIIGAEIVKNKDQLLGTGADLLSMVLKPLTDANALKSIATAAGDVVQDLANGLVSTENIDQLVKKAPDIVKGIADGIITFLTGSEHDGTGGLWGATTDIIKNIGDYFADDNNRAEFAESARKFIKTLSDGIVTLLKSSAPMLVEAGKAWITVFCGAIDYDAGAKEIVKQLSLAFARNFGNGFKGLWNLVTNPVETLDNWINGGEIATDRAGIRISNELQEQYPVGASMGITDWASVQKVRNQYGNLNYTDEELLDWINSGTTQDFDTYFSDYERRRRYKAEHPDQYVPGFAEGGIVTKPTLAWIGERGEPEAVVPLGHETETSRMLGGVTIQFGDIYVNGESGDIGQQIVQQLDEALRVWQLQQKRGVGGTAWQV